MTPSMTTFEDIKWPELTRELRRFVGRRLDHEVEDVVQETLLKVHRNLPELRDDQRFGPWVYQVARNAIIDHHRSRARALERETRAVLCATGDDEQGDPLETPNLNEEVASWLKPMIQKLDEPYRTALMLTEVEGLSQAELAKRLDISRSGARSQVQRGRQKHRQVVERCCKITTDRRGNVIDVDKNDCCCRVVFAAARVRSKGSCFLTPTRTAAVI